MIRNFHYRDLLPSLIYVKSPNAKDTKGEYKATQNKTRETSALTNSSSGLWAAEGDPLEFSDVHVAVFGGDAAL